jgi:sulfur-oxidizing protein SoxX
MRNIPKVLAGTIGAAMMLASLVVAPQAFAANGDGGEMPDKKQCAAAMKAGTDKVMMGGCIATDRRAGNCHACHYFSGIEKTRLQAGNIGPAFANLKGRYSKDQLKEMVSDKSKSNPHTVMPPFGKHKILSGSDIDLVVDWLMSL